MHAIRHERARIDAELHQRARELIRFCDAHWIGAAHNDEAGLRIAQNFLRREPAILKRLEQPLKRGREVDELLDEAFAERLRQLAQRDFVMRSEKNAAMRVGASRKSSAFTVGGVSRTTRS